jgi:hypothetical protein
MRRSYRVILMAGVLPLTLALAGCETSGVWDSANNVSDRLQDAVADFNPFGTGKKPLPGERRAVFPEGVPGVQQGVPSELMRGHQQAEEAPPAAAPPPAPAAKTRTKKTATTAKTAARPRPAAAPEAPEDVWPPPAR